MSGSDRQPFLLLHLVSEIEVRIDQVPEFAIHVVREDAQPDPELRRGQTHPGASIIVSVRSCTSLQLLVEIDDGAAGARKTGSPNSRIHH